MSGKPACLTVRTTVGVDPETYHRFVRCEGHISEIVIGHPPEYEELLDLLRFLESAGAIFLGFTSIDWETVEWEWLPANDEEQSQLEILSARVSRGYKKRTALGL